MMIKKLKQLVTAILFVGMAQNSYALTPLTIEQANQLVEEIMEQIVIEDIPAAIEVAKPHWLVQDKPADNFVIEVESQLKQLGGAYGISIGSDYVGEKRIGESLIHYFYLHKYEINAIYWRFMFYKSGDRWLLSKISYSDKLDRLLDLFPE